MGVAGLWDIVSKAGESRSLAHLAVVDGFELNKSGKRAYRIGIDASIWYQHASFSKGGDNPQLRLLFFRLRSLAELPIIPLFVFDGRERPKEKRGSKKGKSGSHNLTTDMKKLLDVFGMEWRMALGEAEAELAYLNQTGIIDAIMTDDVDALIFGAQTIIKNMSVTLSGNKSQPALNSDGKLSKYHVMLYTLNRVNNHPEIGLSRGGLILFALLAGGDYDKGVDRFGKAIAHGLARCGFGDQLLQAYERRDQQDMRSFLHQWRSEINQELRTNAHGFLPHKHPSLSIPSDFPNMKTLTNYASPICSAQLGHGGGGPVRDTGNLNIPRIVGLCEEKFGKWGHRSAIIKRFRDVMWEAAVCHVLRRAALEADRSEMDRRIAAGGTSSPIRGALKSSQTEAVGTPASLVKKYLSTLDADRRREAFVNQGRSAAARASNASEENPLIRKVVGTRKHVSTDHLLEYRVEISPSQLVALARSGIKGTRPEPSGSTTAVRDGDDRVNQSPKKPAPDPDSVMRIWVPASILQQVHPALVEDFETIKKADGRGKRKGKATASETDADEVSDTGERPQPANAMPRRPVIPDRMDRGEGPSSSMPRAGISPDDTTERLHNPTRFLYWIPYPDAYDPFVPDGDGDVAISGEEPLLDLPRPTSQQLPQLRTQSKAGPSSQTPKAFLLPLFLPDDSDDDEASHRPRRPNHASTQHTRKRPRASNLPLAPAKRWKGADDVIDLSSDDDTEHSLTRAVFPMEPTSSQNSILSADEGDIIDLT